MENFIINGKKHQAKELDFNFVCLLGENGIELQDISKKILPTIRVYAAYCMDADMDYAGNEINEHIIKGGTINDLVDVFSAKADDSDFFRALGKTTNQTDSAETPKKNTKKRAEVSE